MRSQPEDRQQPEQTRETAAAPEARPRRPFADPELVRHERVTRIHLISDAFGGAGSGSGSGGTFF